MDSDHTEAYPNRNSQFVGREAELQRREYLARKASSMPRSLRS
jgi:hypothetical protein